MTMEGIVRVDMFMGDVSVAVDMLMNQVDLEEKAFIP
jgi:hypothetical protein